MISTLVEFSASKTTREAATEITPVPSCLTSQHSLSKYLNPICSITQEKSLPWPKKLKFLSRKESSPNHKAGCKCRREAPSIHLPRVQLICLQLDKRSWNTSRSLLEGHRRDKSSSQCMALEDPEEKSIMRSLLKKLMSSLKDKTTSLLRNL